MKKLLIRLAVVIAVVEVLLLTATIAFGLDMAHAAAPLSAVADQYGSKVPQNPPAVAHTGTAGGPAADDLPNTGVSLLWPLAISLNLVAAGLLLRTRKK